MDRKHREPVVETPVTDPVLPVVNYENPGDIRSPATEDAN